MSPPNQLVLLVGPDHDIDALKAAYEKTSLPYTLIGDGINPVTVEQLQTLSQTIATDARIDIWAHGSAATGRHAIELTSNKADYTTSDLFKTLSSFMPAPPSDTSHMLQCHLWSCFGGATAKNADDLPKNTVLITHASDEYISYKGMNATGIAEGVMGYSFDKDPYLSFAHSITTSPETATLTTIRDSGTIHYTARCSKMPLSKDELARDLKQRVLKEYTDQLLPLQTGAELKDFPLTDAALHNYEKDACVIAQNLNNLDYINRYLQMPDPREDLLYFAATNAGTPILSAVLEHTDDPDIAASNGRTVLHSAVSAHKTDNIKLLLADPRIDPSSKDDDGITPLHLAAQTGDAAPLRLLLAHKKTNMNTVDNYRRSALHHAVIKQHPDMVWELLEHGVSPDLTDKDSNTALNIAKKMPPSTPRMKETLIALLTPLALTESNAPADHEITQYDPSITTLRLHFKNKRARQLFTTANESLFDALRDSCGSRNIFTITQINGFLDNAPTDVGLNISWSIDMPLFIDRKMAHIAQQLTAHEQAAAEAANAPVLFTDLIKKKKPFTPRVPSSPTQIGASGLAEASSSPPRSPITSPRARYEPSAAAAR